MRIDFNKIDSLTFPGMDNGTGMMNSGESDGCSVFKRKLLE